MPWVRFLVAPALLAVLVLAGHGERRRAPRPAGAAVQMAPAALDQEPPSFRAGRLPDSGSQRRGRTQ